MQDREPSALPRGAMRGAMRGGPSRGRPAPRGCPRRGITFADSHSSPEPMDVETNAASSRQGVSGFPPRSFSGPVARRQRPFPSSATPGPVARRACPYHPRPKPVADSSYVVFSPGKACPLCPDFVPPTERAFVSHWLLTHSVGIPLVQCTKCAFVCVRDLAKAKFRLHWRTEHPEELLTNVGARNFTRAEVSVSTRGLRLEPTLRLSADTRTATMLSCAAFKAEPQASTPRSAGAARQARGPVAQGASRRSVSASPGCHRGPSPAAGDYTQPRRGVASTPPTPIPSLLSLNLSMPALPHPRTFADVVASRETTTAPSRAIPQGYLISPPQGGDSSDSSSLPQETPVVTPEAVPQGTETDASVPEAARALEAHARRVASRYASYERGVADGVATSRLQVQRLKRDLALVEADRAVLLRVLAAAGLEMVDPLPSQTLP
eukprot:GHVR01078704.1.p1 GENE.GHVR01078704.1~~GHVR01078704.1.p1  ORF type:complete len:437 (+),score=56.68 GHVR01078704.1:370-1680(+)